jgi:hypothetical protein
LRSCRTRAPQRAVLHTSARPHVQSEGRLGERRTSRSECAVAESDCTCAGSSANALSSDRPAASAPVQQSGDPRACGAIVQTRRGCAAGNGRAHGMGPTALWRRGRLSCRQRGDPARARVVCLFVRGTVRRRLHDAVVRADHAKPGTKRPPHLQQQSHATCNKYTESSGQRCSAATDYVQHATRGGRSAAAVAPRHRTTAPSQPKARTRPSGSQTATCTHTSAPPQRALRERRRRRSTNTVHASLAAAAESCACACSVSPPQRHSAGAATEREPRVRECAYIRCEPAHGGARPIAGGRASHGHGPVSMVGHVSAVSSPDAVATCRRRCPGGGPSRAGYARLAWLPASRRAA